MDVFREILIAVAGLTPQVITETLYYLTQDHKPPITISEIHVLTTQLGRRRILSDLLAADIGRFYTFCAEYGLDPAAIAFDPAHIHVLMDAAGAPLEDIRTANDSSAVADQILAFIRRLTDDPTTRLHCSLAGGRKTQSVLLGFALQLYGRPQDTLLHVLVNEALEGHAEFFYPPKTSRVIQTRDGHPIDAHAARVEVVEISYLRLRGKLLADREAPASGFDIAIEEVQHTLDALPNLPRLVIRPTSRQVVVGRIEVRLQPLELVLYTQFAEARAHRSGEKGFLSLDEIDCMRGAMLHRYERLYGRHSGRVERLRAAWKERIPPESLRMHLANIKRKIENVVPDAVQATFYVVSSRGRYGATRYGLCLSPERIELQE